MLPSWIYLVVLVSAARLLTGCVWWSQKERCNDGATSIWAHRGGEMAPREGYMQCERVMLPLAMCVNLCFIICPLNLFYEDIFRRILINLFPCLKVSQQKIYSELCIFTRFTVIYTQKARHSICSRQNPETKAHVLSRGFRVMFIKSVKKLTC